MKKFLRSLEYHIKNSLWLLFRLFAKKNVPLAPLPLDFSKISNVLVVRTDRLGDVILSTPVYESLKTSFPHLKITVMVNPAQGGFWKIILIFIRLLECDAGSSGVLFLIPAKKNLI